MLDKERVTELVMQSGLHEFGYGHNQERFLTALAYFATALQHEVLKLEREVRMDKGKYTPIVPDARLLEIIRSVTGIDPNRTDWESIGEAHADMTSEINLMRLARLISDEAQARLPLWELEKEHQ